ncbi:hypothetical protein K438DRAFT_1966549 [Mycena galopus ATCC 62051]|nr:hypothetical protein K438DRAFT_1966549 [Mycena galopus ATCC 62051]
MTSSPQASLPGYRHRLHPTVRFPAAFLGDVDGAAENAGDARSSGIGHADRGYLADNRPPSSTSTHAPFSRCLATLNPLSSSYVDFLGTHLTSMGGTDLYGPSGPSLRSYSLSLPPRHPYSLICP